MELSDIKNISKYKASRLQWLRKFIYVDNPYKKDLKSRRAGVVRSTRMSFDP